MKSTLKVTITALIAIMTALPVRAAGPGTSGGLTLVEPFGARSASLAEAMTAGHNDIAAFGYNPASLNSLSSGQASFMYQKRFAEDSYGQFLMGSPLKNGALGLSLGYYKGAQMNVFDGVTEKSVVSQTDLALSLGYARQVGRFNIGVTGKYLSSELIEQAKASAFAGDVGLQMQVSERLRVGAAMQNFGSKLTFVNEGDNLPRIFRGGLSYLLFPQTHRVTMLLDMPYYINEAELRPALGLEKFVGPLALRAGYKTRNGLEEFTLGMGFMVGVGSFDYAFGMVEQLNSNHRVSFSMRFGGESPASVPFVKANPAPEPVVAALAGPELVLAQGPVVEPSNEAVSETAAPQARFYSVKRGDTLSKIAKKFYGDMKAWKRIYAANETSLEKSGQLEVRQRLYIP